MNTKWTYSELFVNTEQPQSEHYRMNTTEWTLTEHWGNTADW